jgi:predicted HTH domain antitoxin
MLCSTVQEANMSTVKISIEMDRSVLSALRQDPHNFGREMRLAVAEKWYEIGRVSQGKVAEIAGVSRAEFLAALANFEVSPWQYTADEVCRESSHA